MNDVFTNGFFRGVELAFIIWFMFHGIAWIINTARDMYGAD
jgi:D-alanyl-lipoteichoic acid acyltransferase DltB (MBOAT superfamily)